MVAGISPGSLNYAVSRSKEFFYYLPVADLWVLSTEISASKMSSYKSSQLMETNLNVPHNWCELVEPS